MLAKNVLAVLAATASASAAATRRARTCTFELSHLRIQRPVGGGDATLGCFAKLDYGDGRSEKLSENCYDTVRSGCYDSQLPNRICVHTNDALGGGYIDYGKEHRDYNEDGCTKTGYANPAGGHKGVKCSFPCS